MTENSTAKNESEAGKQDIEEMSFADLFEMDENSAVSKVGDDIQPATKLRRSNHGCREASGTGTLDNVNEPSTRPKTGLL